MIFCSILFYIAYIYKDAITDCQKATSMAKFVQMYYMKKKIVIDLIRNYVRIIIANKCMCSTKSEKLANSNWNDQTGSNVSKVYKNLENIKDYGRNEDFEL